MHTIHPIKALKDNYIWTLLDEEKTQAIVVDPGEAAPVLAFLKTHPIQLTAIFITHHHGDHCQGVPELLTQFPTIKIYGYQSPLQPWVNMPINAVEQISIHLGTDTLDYRILSIPGHTLDHTAYIGHGNLFCGDTLFCAGCGRIFEGTPEQMYHSLLKLKALPDNTRIYCGHEYTLQNLRFALTVETANSAILKRIQLAQDQTAQGLATLPSTIADEKAINPFFRCDQADVIQSVSRHIGAHLSQEIDIFTHLRQWKNIFS